MISAFGVEDPRISKADGDQPPAQKWHNKRWELTDKERALGPEPKPVRKPNAYVPGTITLHQEQAKVEGRKKAAANRRVNAGSSIAGAGLAAGAAVHGLAHPIARAITPTEADVGRNAHLGQLARNVRRVRIAGLGGGLAVAGAGGGLAVHGAIGRARHQRAQDASNAAAQAARQQRMADRDWSHEDFGPPIPPKKKTQRSET